MLISICLRFNFMLNAPQDTGEIEYRRVAPSGLNSPEMIKLRKKWALACFAVIL